MSHDNETKLREEIIKLSQLKEWELARREWVLDKILFSNNKETCLCGHSPISELCFLKNKLNGNDAMVGNICVYKFMGLPSNLIFQGIKRIIDNQHSALNVAATEYSYEKKWINDWEYDFCNDTRFKKNPLPKQLEKRIQINLKIIKKVC